MTGTSMLPTICLDPGHGGADPGAVYGQLVEKELNLSLALDLRLEIKALHWPCSCELTRAGDEAMTLDERGQRSREVGADLVICLHHNAAESNASGMMAFVLDPSGPAVEVARLITEAAPLELRRQSTRVVTARAADWTKRAYNCLRVYQCPAVLIEVAFLSSDKDRALLQSPAVQQGLTVALLAGIAQFMRCKEVAP